MKAIGLMTRHTAKEDLSTLMVTCMKATGLKTKRMARVFTFTLTVEYTRVTGKTISSTGKELRNGLMAFDMRVILNLERNTVQADLSGLTTQSSKVISTSTRFTEPESISVPTMTIIKENGISTTCQVLLRFSGRMVASSKVNFRTIIT